MHVISKKTINEFVVEHKSSGTALDEWYKRLKALKPNDLVELRLTFPTADLIGGCVVFNVGGNKYRVIAKVRFSKQTVYLKFVLTHSEYDEDKWKADCC